MKRVLPQFQYRFLEKELKALEEDGKLVEGQAEKLLSNYEIQQSIVPEKKKINPINILLIIGAVLIGLSILSFVASNWSELTRLTKFILLFVLLIAFYLTGFKLEDKNKKLSRVLYYIGAFTYGAEIIYIGQMFHLGGEIQTAILCWGIGILPLGFHLKDQVLKLAGLFFVYLYVQIQFMFADNLTAYIVLLLLPIMFAFGYYVMNRSIVLLVVNFIVLYEFIQIHLLLRPLEVDRFPLEMLVVLPGLFYIGHKIMNKSVLLFVYNVLLALVTIGVAISFYLVDYFTTLILLVFFVIGMVLTYVQFKDYILPTKIIGLSLQVVTGVILTIPGAWQDLIGDAADITTIVFAIIYVLYHLHYVKQGNLVSVAVLSCLIFRFYVDLSLAFMNKSITFLFGGLLLIGLGYWVDRTRKKGAGKNEKE